MKISVICGLWLGLLSPVFSSEPVLLPVSPGEQKESVIFMSIPWTRLKEDHLLEERLTAGVVKIFTLLDGKHGKIQRA